MSLFKYHSGLRAVGLGCLVTLGEQRGSCTTPGIYHRDGKLWPERKWTPHLHPHNEIWPIYPWTIWQHKNCRICLTDKQTCLLFTNAKTSGSLASEILDMQQGAAVAIPRKAMRWVLFEYTLSKYW